MVLSQGEQCYDPTTCHTLADTRREADTRHECKVADGQEVTLATTFEGLLGEDKTTDETANDTIHAVYAWRDVTSSKSLD